MAKLQNVPVSVAGHAANAAFAEFDQQRARPKDTGPDRLAAFAHRVKPKYQESRVTQVICPEFEAFERREVKNLAIFMPPREGKSTHASELFPAWYLGRHPENQIILASYNDELAERNSRAVRDIVRDEELWPYPECKVRSDVQGVSHWMTTKGGIVRAAGIGGGLTGYGFHVGIIDDYVKKPEEAMSPIIRESTWAWYTTVFHTRAMDGGQELLVATRWHEDDLAGRILNSDEANDWRVIKIPAFALPGRDYESGEGDPLGRAEGEFMNGRVHEIQVRKAMAIQSATDAAALYQQSPHALEGNMFKRADWRRYRLEELLNEGLVPLFTTVDTAFKTDTEHDYSVASTWGAFRGRAYLMDRYREKVPFARLIVALHRVYEKWKVPLIIEDRASGQSAIQVMAGEHVDADQLAEGVSKMLRQGLNRIPIIAFKPPRFSTDVSMANAATPFVQAHQVFLPDGEDWVEEWIEEHARFPNGAHDDQVRTTSMALPRLFASMAQEQQGEGRERWTTYRIGTTRDDGGSLDAVLSRELFGR